MHLRHGAWWTFALVPLLVFGTWITWRTAKLANRQAAEPGVGTAQLPQGRLWYPVAPPTVVGRLRAFFLPGEFQRDAALAATGPRLPLIVYFGGWPGTGIDNNELIRALVGEGFVVAATNAEPDAVEPMDFSSAAAYENTLRRADTRARLLARKAVDLIASLESLDRLDPQGRFTGRLDMSHVGILGYSFGGAVAAQAAWLDGRFRAVVNLDGWSFADAAVEGIQQPYLYISDDTPMPTAADLASSNPDRRYTSELTQNDQPRLLHNLARHAGIYLLLSGTNHSSFVDRGLLSRVREFFGFPPDSGTRVQEILRAYVPAFFRSRLQGVESPLLRGRVSRFPEVRFPPLESVP